MSSNLSLTRTAALVLTLLLVARAIYASKGNKQQQAAALFDRAEKLTNIWAKGSPGFVLDAEVTLYGRAGSNEDGVFHEIWESNGESIVDVEFPGYHDISVDHAGRTWASSTYSYVPYGVYQLGRAVAFARRLKPLQKSKLTKIKKREIGGVAALCAAAGEKQVHGFHEFCFDQATGYLILERDPIWRTTFEFGDYAPFGNKLFPRKLLVLQSGQLVIEAKVKNIASNPKIRAAALVPPPGVQASPILRCGKGQSTNAKAISQPGSLLPAPRRINGMAGTVVLYADIGKDGVPRGFTVLASPGAELTRSAIALVSQWRYRPFACNGIPADAFSKIEVDYSVNRPEHRVHRISPPRARRPL